MSDTIECLWCEAIVLREDAHPLDAKGENHQCESCNDDAHERRTASVA